MAKVRPARSRKKKAPARKKKPEPSRQPGKRSDPDFVRAGYLLPVEDVDRLRLMAVLAKRDQSGLMAEALAALLKKHRKLLGNR